MAQMEVSDIISRMIESFTRDNINTAIPAEVIEVGRLEAEQVISVKPVFQQEYRDGVVLDFPEILDVPVMFPSAGGGMLSFPIKVGETVLLVFSMRSLDNWKLRDTGAGAHLPTDNRHFDLTDAIAIPGLYTTKDNLTPNPEDVELKYTDSSIRLTKDGDVIVATEGALTVTTAKDITITCDGDVNLKAGVVNVAASEVNLGEGGKPIARVGDKVLVEVKSGSSVGFWVGEITNGGTNTSI